MKLLSMEIGTNDDKGNPQNIILLSSNLCLFVIYGKITVSKEIAYEEVDPAIRLKIRVSQFKHVKI